MVRATPPPLVQLVLIPILFFIGVKLSLAFAVMPEVVVMLWLPNGLLLAALLHYDLRRYGLFAALIVAAEIAADYPTFSLAEAALFGVINLVEVTIAYSLLRRWRFDARFTAPSDLAKFLIAGPVAGAFAAACLAAAVYRYLRGAETAYFDLMRVWWLSDATGLLIVTPLVLSVWPPAAPTADEPVTLRWFDGVVAVLALAVIGLVLAAEKGMVDGTAVRPVVLLPFLVYAAARFPPRATTLAMVAFAAVVLFVTKNGQQPFGELPVGETVFQAQVLVLIMNVTSLGLSALLSQLRATTRGLEVRVAERTAELRAMNEQLRRLAVTDPLTGTMNRRALFELMKREMERHLRHGHALAVVLFDVDHFKDVNDRYGHNSGDAVLRHVATVTAHMVRSTDALARYGGEEFVIVAPETDAARALQLAERIREALQSSYVTVEDRQLAVTASFGVATLCAGDGEPEQILARADRALYAAKVGGRNQVVADPPLPVGA
jgi:diguanylate cyclase (GGDEF)-like protein